MKAWLVRYLSKKAVEFYRLFPEREDAVDFHKNPGEGCVPLDPEPNEISPEELIAYTLRLKTTPS
jgi:hypothetical protein